MISRPPSRRSGPRSRTSARSLPSSARRPTRPRPQSNAWPPSARPPPAPARRHGRRRSRRGRRPGGARIERRRTSTKELPGWRCATLGFDVRHLRRVKREELVRSSSSPSVVSQNTRWHRAGFGVTHGTTDDSRARADCLRVAAISPDLTKPNPSHLPCPETTGDVLTNRS